MTTHSTLKESHRMPELEATWATECPAPLQGGGAVAQGEGRLPPGCSGFLTGSQSNADVALPSGVFLFRSLNAGLQGLFRARNKLVTIQVGPGAIGWKQDSFRETQFRTIHPQDRLFPWLSSAPPPVTSHSLLSSTALRQALIFPVTEGRTGARAKRQCHRG